MKKSTKQLVEAAFKVGDKVGVTDRDMMTYYRTGVIHSIKGNEYFVKFKDDVAGTTLIPHTANQLKLIKESMSTKQLLGAANRKCEMRWKVLAFDPEQDNKLVKEIKDLDCIDCAVAKKREYLEKNPTHIVEVISESNTQKNKSKTIEDAKTEDIAKYLKSKNITESHNKNEDKEKVFVRNMTTGNSYYINKDSFDAHKYELIDDSQQSSTDTKATSLAFEVHDLQSKIKQLEKEEQRYKKLYNSAMKAIDSPYTNYEEIERNKQKASKVNDLWTVASDRLNKAKAELIKKQNALKKSKG